MGWPLGFLDGPPLIIREAATGAWGKNVRRLGPAWRGPHVFGNRLRAAVNHINEIIQVQGQLETRDRSLRLGQGNGISVREPDQRNDWPMLSRMPFEPLRPLLEDGHIPNRQKRLAGRSRLWAASHAGTDDLIIGLLDRIPGRCTRLGDGATQFTVRAGHEHSKNAPFGARRAAGAAFEQTRHMPGKHIAGRRLRKHQIDETRITLELFIADVRADTENQGGRGPWAVLRSPFLESLGIARREPLPMHDDETRQTAGIGWAARQLARAIDARDDLRSGQCISNRHDPGITQIAEKPDRPIGIIHRSHGLLAWPG
jgi:hypothetical protein